MRTVKKFPLKDTNQFKTNLFKWNEQFEVSVWLDSNNYEQHYTSFDACLAVEEFTSIRTDYDGAFDKLKEYQSYTKDYLFGYISYDVKNDVEKLSSTNSDNLCFDDMCFFQPKKIIFIKDENVEFHYLKMVDDEIDDDYNKINELDFCQSKNQLKTSLGEIKSRLSEEEYVTKIEQVLEHIQKGDIYEVNFCQEFFIENSTIDAYQIFRDLNSISEPPFATFMRFEDEFLISASPERYIRKEGSRIISQPIKGTAKRFESIEQDKLVANELTTNEKERSENIMIVDLVRNDLSKTAKKGSVNVEELCELYSFKQVHQLISTVVSEVEYDIHAVDVIRTTFPMGSMTGAPKVSAMKIIEELEVSKRGLYSGAVGYFTPDSSFDFNVIIRSILYNHHKEYISYTVGGAITSKSDPKLEYKECLLKAKAMKQVLMNY